MRGSSTGATSLTVRANLLAKSFTFSISSACALCFVAYSTRVKGLDPALLVNVQEAVVAGGAGSRLNTS